MSTGVGYLDGKKKPKLDNVVKEWPPETFCDGGRRKHATVLVAFPKSPFWSPPGVSECSESLSQVISFSNMDQRTRENYSMDENTPNSPRRKKGSGGMKKKKKKNQPESEKTDTSTAEDAAVPMSKNRQFAKLNEMRQNKVHFTRGKSLLELWVTTFLPDCQPRLMFV